MTLIYFVVLAASASLANTQSSCRTPSGGAGECISIKNCQPLKDLVLKKDRTPEDVNLLKKSECGYQDDAPAVCCPKNGGQEGTWCYTPEGNPGKCISLNACTHLANMLKPSGETPVSDENIDYVKKSRCGSSVKQSVCCGTNPDQIKDVGTGNCASKVSAFPPDPNTECCGVDSRTANKIVGGKATAVDQYPWLALIEYEKDGVTKVLCAGTLISGKYVLTTGHCVAGQVLNIGTPRRVRLGEYDISHEGPDCAEVEAGGQDCTDGAIRILIEKTIPHPEYNSVHKNKAHDIALIKLQEMAPFTDFIRPICLPIEDLTLPQNIPQNFILYVAGWGAVNSSVTHSNIKLHVDLPFVDQEKCQVAYGMPGRRVKLGTGHICAGGIKGKDTCKGDTGGPLMYKSGGSYQVIGIISFGPVPCGLEGVPGVYTKIYEYIYWIMTTIEL